MWVKRSWEAISDEIIIRSFKKCKISNSLDESDESGDDSEDGSEYESIDESADENEDNNLDIIYINSDCDGNDSIDDNNSINSD